MTMNFSSNIDQLEELQHQDQCISRFNHSLIAMEEQRIHPTKDTRINANDILCGRGKTSFHHVGNRRFRDMISTSIIKYINADTRLQKSMVVNAILGEIRATGGRFLKRDISGKWNELDTRQAKEKVGHAIRDAVSALEMRKKKQPKRAKFSTKICSNFQVNEQFGASAKQSSDTKMNFCDPGLVKSSDQVNMHYSWPSSCSDDLLCCVDYGDESLEEIGNIIDTETANTNENKNIDHEDVDDSHFLAQIDDALRPVELDGTTEDTKDNFHRSY